MFPTNSVLLRIFAPADAASRSGHHWAQLSGLLTRRAADRVCALPLGTGSKRASRTTGFVRAKLYGPESGRLSRSPLAADTRKNADAHTMMRLIVNAAG